MFHWIRHYLLILEVYLVFSQSQDICLWIEVDHATKQQVFP